MYLVFKMVIEKCCHLCCTATGVGFLNLIVHVYSDNKGILFYTILPLGLVYMSV